MATQNDSTFREGQSTTRPPYFDGNDYPYWKTRMRIYLQALDYEIWEIVNDGPFMPLTKNEVGEDIPKPSREWNKFKKRKASLNSKAMNALFCALDKKEFHRVSSCESANEIWHKLEVVYEGTNQVKESKISRHEEKKKNIALKASKCESDDESEMDDEELAMLARRFRKFYKKNNEQRKFRGYKNKKEPITCYECKKPGHIQLECPLLNKLKKKAMVGTWDDSDEETSDDDEQHEMTNLALIVVGEESCDELDEVSVLPTYDELHDAFKDLHDELIKIEPNRFPSLNRYTSSSHPENRSLIDFSGDKFRITGFSTRLLSASKPDNRFLKSGKPNSRGNFLPQTGLPVSKTGKPDSHEKLAGSKPDFRFTSIWKAVFGFHLSAHNRLADVGWLNALVVEENVYSDLVKVFYLNMDCSVEKENRVITTVGGVLIEFDDSELNSILRSSDDGLEIFSPRKPPDIDDYVYIDAVKNICHRVDFSDEDCTIHFRNKCLCLQTRILLRFIQSIVLPRSGHLDEISHMDVALIDCILRHRPVDLGYTIVRNMLSIPELITRSLPYGHFITRILKFFDVPIKEPSCRPSKGIGDDAIFGLGFEWKNGTWVKYIKNKFTFLAPSDDRPLDAVPLIPEDVTLQQLMNVVRTLSVRQTEFQQQQLIHGQHLLFEHFGIPCPYPPPSSPSSPPE
ncbi:hypothetical protein KPL70_014139 [Citrus sinensis]|nr:hypothetical protein KPL70_014139 [Citrus sinensis]